SVSCIYVFHSSIYFIRTCPPPISSLFPYTTLFRSDTLLGVSMGCRRKADLKPKLKGSCRTLTPREKEDPAGGLDELMAVPRRSRDRKSTRLNSSHGSISYAVFCLKKKKQ